MKGIILAGGAGSRLYPSTNVITKQLQPLYDKPMIYYPLSFLMLGNIKDFLIITTEVDQERFKNLLGDGTQLGINIQYATQDHPRGIAEAFIIGEKFIGNDDVNLILGDNLFHGDLTFYREAIKQHLQRKVKQQARVFGYNVSNPKDYGVIEFDKDFKVLSIEEKPKTPKSNFAIPGLYMFDSSVSARAKTLKPSARGELEIVDLIKTYLLEENLHTSIITRGVAWLDTGTPKTLLEAAMYISAIEERQGLKVACLEEVAYRMNFINKKQFEALIEKTPKSPYKDYLLKITNNTF